MGQEVYGPIKSRSTHPHGHLMKTSVPCSNENEEAILSFIINNPEKSGEAFSEIDVEAFYHAPNRLMFQAMLEMSGQSVPIDAYTLSDWLATRGLTERIGGGGVVSRLEYEQAWHYPYYRGIVLDRWKQRQMIDICSATIREITESKTTAVDDMLGVMTEKVLALSLDRQQRREKPFMQLVDEAMDRYEAAVQNKGKLPGISTGFFGLDRVTGGHQPGQLWVIGGGTSDGKSAFAQQMALHMAANGHRTAIYTLEMPDDEVVDRLYAMHAKVDSALFKRGFENRGQMMGCVKANKELRDMPFHIRDVSGIKLSPLLSDIRVLAKRGVKHFVVDYGQLIEGEGNARSREEEVAKMSRGFKAAAKILRVSIDLLSQLNDDGKLRESRAIGFDADVVATLSCPMVEEKVPGSRESNFVRLEDKRVLFLSKNRNGARGVKFAMSFNGPTFTFTEEAKREENA